MKNHVFWNTSQKKATFWIAKKDVFKLLQNYKGKELSLQVQINSTIYIKKLPVKSRKQLLT